METLDLSRMRKEEKPLHILVYGEAGCGKTHFVRDFPKPMLVLDLDDKYEPLIGVPGIELVQYKMEKPEDARLLIPKFWRDWQAAKKDDKWATIVVDSITALDRMLERYVVITSGKGKAAGDRATIQEYGDMKRWYATFFPSLRTAVDKNIIILAHEQERTNDEGQLTSIRPYITGKTGDILSSIFPHTFHLEHVTGAKERRVLHYKKHKKYVCSSSSLSQGSGAIEDPTYDKILEVVTKNVG